MPDWVEVDARLRSFLAGHVGLLEGIPLSEVGVDLAGGAEASEWARGGCAILAQGLAWWLGEDAQMVMFCDNQGPLHVAVRYAGVLLDGYGVSREERRLEELDEYLEATTPLEEWGDEAPQAWVEEFRRAAVRRAGIPLDAERSRKLARALRTEMGELGPELITGGQEVGT